MGLAAHHLRGFSLIVAQFWLWQSGDFLQDPILRVQNFFLVFKTFVARMTHVAVSHGHSRGFIAGEISANWPQLMALVPNHFTAFFFAFSKRWIYYLVICVMEAVKFSFDHSIQSKCD